MGPQHPATHAVLRLMLRLDGEIVREAVPHIGYLHRCAEKIGESIAYTQYVPFTDRLDYLGSMNNNLGYCMAVEKLLGIQVPERAEYIRVIMAELNRIASHLVAFGTYGADVGAVTPFLYGFRERERIIDLFESACGARLTYNYIRIGGVAQDVPEGFVEKTREFIKYFKPKIGEYNRLLSENPIFVKRTAGIGVLPAELAVNYGVTGPSLRGSGVKRDLRKDMPYSVYHQFDFEVVEGKGLKGKTGDCWDRYMVRIREMEESLKIIEQALDALPAGEVSTKLLRVLKCPTGEVYVRTESPRGELGFYIISDSSTKPYRLKIRAPSFSNLSAISELCRGVLVADAVAILGSIDIVLGEVDR